MADLFADQYLPPTSYRTGGEEYIPPLNGGAPMDDAAAAPLMSASVNTDPKSWYRYFTSMNVMLWLAFAMGLVALILAVLVWYGCMHVKKQVKCLTCKEFPKMRDGFKNWSNNICPLIGLVQLAPGWGYVGSTGTISATGMLISAGTTPGATITVNALTPLGSVVQTPYGGYLRGLSVQINAALTAGSATYTVTVNGVATVLQAVMANPSTDLTEFVAPADPIRFEKGDTIGVTIAHTGVGISTTTFTSAAQVLVQYRVETSDSSS